ncbi:MAG: hypothetical protein WB474_00950, partial [Nitrososphaeraceae archaeon]
LQTYMDSNRMWMPYMLFSGLMNVLFFTSMLSFIGMTMSPSESSVADNSGSSSDASDTAGTDNQADAGSASDATDTGDMSSDGGGFDGGGFDGGGFDGGGFGF